MCACVCVCACARVCVCVCVCALVCVRVRVQLSASVYTRARTCLCEHAREAPRSSLSGPFPASVHTCDVMSSGSASAGTGLTVTKPIAEVADAARSKWGAGPLQNIDLDLLGVAPWNRGRLGVSPFHVDDVLLSIRVDGLSRNRYREVVAIRVPDAELESFRSFNKDVLATSSDLPAYSNKMIYACLTKHLCCLCRTDRFLLQRVCTCTRACVFAHACVCFSCQHRNHFVSALKLLKNGRPAPNSADKQLKRHLLDGPVCQVMDEGMYKNDEPGLPAPQLHETCAVPRASTSSTYQLCHPPKPPTPLRPSDQRAHLRLCCREHMPFCIGYSDGDGDGVSFGHCKVGF